MLLPLAQNYFDEAFGPFYRVANVLVVAKNEGDDLLNYEHLSDLHELQQEFDGMQATYNGETFGLEQICLKPVPEEPCVVSSVLDYWNYQNGPYANVSENLVRDELQCNREELAHLTNPATLSYCCVTCLCTTCRK